MSRSPAVILYDSSGNALAVENGVAIPSNTKGVLIHGRDSSGNARVAQFIDDDGVNRLQAEVKPATGHWVSEINPDNSVEGPSNQLIIGGTYVGTAVDVSGFSAVAITIHSDQDSALDGMRFEFSIDGTNWDDVYKFNLVASESQTRRFQFPVCAQYFRVNYINGSTPTTEFRCQTILHRQNILTSIHRVQDVVRDDRSAQVVKSTVIAQREGFTDQDFYPVKSDVQGNLKVTSVGTDVPSNPAFLVLTYCEDIGGDHVMLVDGSTTPVNFEAGPGAGEVWSIRELLLTFTADDFSFDGVSFGPNPALTNGIDVKVIQDSVSTGIFKIVQNEDFLRVPGRTPLVNNTGPKDVLGAGLAFQGLILSGDDGDRVQVTVNDNLTSVKYKFLAATLFAVKVS